MNWLVVTLLEGNEREAGVVALHLPIGTLKMRYWLEPVPRCEPSTYMPISRWHSYGAIGTDIMLLVFEVCGGCFSLVVSLFCFIYFVSLLLLLYYYSYFNLLLLLLYFIFVGWGGGHNIMPAACHFRRASPLLLMWEILFIKDLLYDEKDI